MDLEFLIDALAPAEVVGAAAADISDLAYDARDAGPGSLYFCIPGTRADGHDFAPQAVANARGFASVILRARCALARRRGWSMARGR